MEEGWGRNDCLFVFVFNLEVVGMYGYVWFVSIK